MKKIIASGVIREAIWILIATMVLGFTANFLNTKGAAISFDRPAMSADADSVFAIDLPPVNFESVKSPKIINAEQIKALMEKDRAVLLDARIKDEYDQGHIPGAVHLPYEMIFDYQEQLQSLPRDKWLVCYCDGPQCDLSTLLANDLIIMGYGFVAIYEAGLNDWLISGKIVQGKDQNE